MHSGVCMCRYVTSLRSGIRPQQCSMCFMYSVAMKCCIHFTYTKECAHSRGHTKETVSTTASCPAEVLCIAAVIRWPSIWAEAANTPSTDSCHSKYRQWCAHLGASRFLTCSSKCSVEREQYRCLSCRAPPGAQCLSSVLWLKLRP